MPPRLTVTHTSSSTVKRRGRGDREHVAALVHLQARGLYAAPELRAALGEVIGRGEDLFR
jgi:hypothetical protein